MKHTTVKLRLGDNVAFWLHSGNSDLTETLGAYVGKFNGNALVLVDPSQPLLIVPLDEITAVNFEPVIATL